MVEKKLKTSVTDKIVESMTQNSHQSIDQATDSIIQKFTELVEGIASALDGEIQQADAQIKGVLAELEKGQASADQRLQVLDRCAADARALNNELDDLIFELMQ